jgi:CO/xanthine dehydrogenase Mo-binding subunit
MDRNAGYMLNANLENYKILGAREVPQIEFGTAHYSDGNTAYVAGSAVCCLAMHLPMEMAV